MTVAKTNGSEPSMEGQQRPQGRAQRTKSKEGGGPGSEYGNGALEPYPLGTQVRIELNPGTERQGEVVAFDHLHQLIIIKAPIPGQTHRVQTHLINLTHIHNIVKLADPPADYPPPRQAAAADFEKLKQKLEKELAKRERSFTSVPVSPLGQKLFYAIQRTIEETRWDGANLMVVELVRISDPYGPEDVQPIDDSHAAATAAERVRMIVARAHAKFNSRQEAEWGMEAQDPAILSANLHSLPLPSASSASGGPVFFQEGEDSAQPEVNAACTPGIEVRLESGGGASPQVASPMGEDREEGEGHGEGRANDGGGQGSGASLSAAGDSARPRSLPRSSSEDGGGECEFVDAPESPASPNLPPTSQQLAT